MTWRFNILRKIDSGEWVQVSWKPEMRAAEQVVRSLQEFWRRVFHPAGQPERDRPRAKCQINEEGSREYPKGRDARSSVSFECSIEIATTPQRVFAFLTEPELVKLWQLDLPEPPPLPEGGLSVGTRQRATVEEHGRKMAIETVVTDLIMNELIAWEMESPNADVKTEFRLIRQGEATVLRQTVTMNPKGFLRLLWPLLRSVFTRKARSRLQLLKEKAEAHHRAITT